MTDMMKTCVICMLFFLAAMPLLHATSPEEDYLPIYNRIQQADRLLRSGREAEAQRQFLQAQSELQALGRAYPNWNPNVVQFRLNYIASKLAEISADAAPIPDVPPPKVMPPTVTLPPDELAQLRDRVRQLELEKEDLTARLREALAARPARTDPEELDRAEERIRQQEREIELLRVNLEKAQAESPQTPDPALDAAQEALLEASRQLSDQQQRMAVLTLERDALQTRLLAAVREIEELKRRPVADPQPSTAPVMPPAAEVTVAEAEELKGQLRTLHQELAREKSRNELLTAERALLESRLDELAARSPDTSVQRIRALEKEIAAARDAARTDTATISALQTALAVARQEQSRLEDELRRQRLQAASSRASLLEPAARTTALQRPPADDIQARVTELQARLAILEARRTPYQAEELALFRVPTINRAGSEQPGQSDTPPRPSAATVTLIAEAEKAARAGRFADAESKYEEALRVDQDNVAVLNSLAFWQIEQERWNAARQTLDRALAQNPRNATSLYHLGRVYYHQGRLDDALSVLSRSAHMDGSNPQTFDFLGLTLSQMGLRDPAETALRRAIQLAPGNGSAHHNLAVIYVLQEPPATELARWHYQRTLAAGFPRNPALETKLDGSTP